MIDVAIPIFLVVCAITVIFLKDLLSAIMVFSVFSLSMAIEWVRLNAVDVAITEAAVGAGITTVLFMAVLSKTVRKETVQRGSAWLALLMTVVVTVFLMYGTVDLPNLRDPTIPPSTHVAPEYLERSYKDTGAINVVAAILASYRGYDTLGEVTVVSTAGMCAILLLRMLRKKEDDNGETKQESYIQPKSVNQAGEVSFLGISKVITRMMIPFIQLYGLYVITHGDYGPGGGFQGGVILAVSIMLYVLSNDQRAGYKRISQKSTDTLISSGVLIYGGIGILALILGGNYLQYNALLPDPKLASHLGILGIEIGIGITVAAVMITLFNETIRRDDA